MQLVTSVMQLVMIYTDSTDFQITILMISQIFHNFFESLSCPPAFLKFLPAVYLCKA